jgi:hypothetical protein
LVSTLQEVQKDKNEIKQVAFTPTGGWVVLYGKNWFKANGLPEDAAQALFDLHSNGREIYSVAFGPESSWLVVGQGK